VFSGVLLADNSVFVKQDPVRLEPIRSLDFSMCFPGWGAKFGSAITSAERRMISSTTGESATIRILILEDNPADAALALRSLAAGGLRVESDQTRNASEFMQWAAAKAYDVILCDFTLPGWGGLEALRWVRQFGLDVPFIYVSGTLGEETAVDCIREGATDYVLKNNLTRLPHAVRRALDERNLRQKQSRLEQEHQESEKQYRLLFESNPQPMWVFDRTTLTFLAVNEAAIRHYGYSREEFLRMTLLDLQPKEEPSVGLTSGLQSRPRGLEQAENRTHRKRDGTLIEAEIFSHEVNFRGTGAMLVLAHDVTAVLRNEERLRQSEEKFSKAFRSSPAAITISTKAEGRYLDANDVFLHMIGRQREEVVGRTTLELCVWEIPEDRTRMIAELDRVGLVSSFETVFNSRSHGTRAVQVSAELIQLEGTSCVLAITNDITEARTMEEQFRQAQKMEAAGRLAGGVAHDFNNMLGVIMGYCDLAEGRAHPDAVGRDVAQIRKAAQHAARLTGQLLAFSRQQVLRPSVLNLNAVVGDLLQMLLRVISADVDLRFQPSLTLGNVRADSSQVEQILMNLVVNACDAMPQGGKIIIETADLELDESYTRRHPKVRPGAYVVLSVSDTGSGIAPATMAKIFDPFFTTKSPGQGTGLGLSMVYGAMEQAGGHVGVYSEEGKGATFRLYFPRIEEEAESRSPARTEAAVQGGPETVLLVEDERGLREVTAELLRTEGYTVLEAADGPAAIARSTDYAEPIHVLLADVVLPGLNGRELANRICKSRPHIKVVYMSGYTGPLIANQAVLEPGVVLLPKPFTRLALLRQLRTVLDQAAEG
jgi:PAS domain S-box-containing protein